MKLFDYVDDAILYYMRNSNILLSEEAHDALLEVVEVLRLTTIGDIEIEAQEDEEE